MFVAEKVLHEIAFLLKLNGNRMHLSKLVKELYLIDRLSIKERDSSVSGDSFCSMDHGPVLSGTLNMLHEIATNQWGNYLQAIKTRDYFPDIYLNNDLEPDLLSEKEREYISKISNQFLNYTPAQIEEYTCRLPEWRNPKGSSRKIKFVDIMKGLNKSDDEIIEAQAEYEFFEALSDLRDAN